MTQMIEKIGRKARKRMMLNGLLDAVPKYLLVYLSMAGIAIAISKLWPIGVDGTQWFVGSVLVAVLATLAHSIVWAVRNNPSLLQATIEFDHRYRLKERLSSALMIQSNDTTSPLGEALLADASKKSEMIDLRDEFAIRFKRPALWPILPAACLALFWFAPDPVSQSQQQVAQQNQTTATQVKNATTPLLDQLRKKRMEAEEKGLNETAELFKQLEGELEKLQKQGTLEKSEVLSKLNDLKEKMEERRKEVGSGENLQKNLDKLKDLTDGPAEELAKAMEQGDFEAAREQVNELKDKLLNNQLSPEEKQKLAEQLDQMEKALKDAVQKNAAQQKELEKKLEAAKNAGDTQQAAELQSKLDKMENSAAQMDKLQEIAEQLANAKENMQSGNSAEAANQLQQLSEQLQELSEQAQESDELDQMLEEFEQSKDSMKCGECDGEGCSQCQGGKSSSGKNGQKQGSKANQGKGENEGNGSGKKGNGGKGKGGESEGEGLGEGQGAGDRPEKENDTDTYESQLRDKMQKGETVFGGKVGGANKKGVSREDVKAAVENSVLEDAEALESENLPRSRRDQTRDYFKNLREDKGG